MAAAVRSSAISRWTSSINKSLTGPKLKVQTTGKTWSTSLWGCFEPLDLCAITLCCPGTTFGKTYHRMENEGHMENYEHINTPCLLYSLGSCIGLHWVIQTLELSELRAKHGLEGNLAIDLCKSFCCTCCALVQAEKESIKLLHTAGGGVDGTHEEGYAAGAGADMMIYELKGQERGEPQQ